MPSFKNSRMSEDIHRELTDIFRQVKDPRVGMEDTRQSVKGLRSAAGFIRRELFARLKMRKSPELTFIADDSIARGAEVTRKLSEIETTEEVADGESD